VKQVSYGEFGHHCQNLIEQCIDDMEFCYITMTTFSLCSMSFHNQNVKISKLACEITCELNNVPWQTNCAASVFLLPASSMPNLLNQSNFSYEHFFNLSKY
jgi:hypothetical protein